MSLPNRLSLGGLVAQLSLEPGFADVFVEGPFDQAVIRHCLKAEGIKRASVREINDIDIPAELCNEGGNRQRLVVLSNEVEKELGPDLRNLSVCIDRDFDALATPLPEYGPYVFATDQTCLEAYFWDAELLEKVADLFLEIDVVDTEALLASLLPVVEELFLIRAGQHHLGIESTLGSARKLVTVDAGIVVGFDRDEYVTRLLDGAGQAGRAADLATEIEVLRAQPDQGLLLNGHDFVDLLGHVLRPITPTASRPLLAPRSLARGISAAANWADIIAGSQQLTTLIDRLRSNEV
jgi:hypothetical protein